MISINSDNFRGGILSPLGIDVPNLGLSRVVHQQVDATRYSSLHSFSEMSESSTSQKGHGGSIRPNFAGPGLFPVNTPRLHW